jgi:hypothetical protein
MIPEDFGTYIRKFFIKLPQDIITTFTRLQFTVKVKTTLYLSIIRVRHGNNCPFALTPSVPLSHF